MLACEHVCMYEPELSPLYIITNLALDCTCISKLDCTD